MLKPSFATTAHPLWLCGFRPFFLLTALSGAGLIALWVAFLGHGLPLPPVVGGPLIWHAHELIFGFALAAVAGFALTSIPEFTATASIARKPVQLLVGLWLLGRVAFWLSGLFAGAPGTLLLLLSGLAHLGLPAVLLAQLAPRLLADPEGRHRSFVWALLAYGGLITGFYIDALLGNPPERWLHATLGLLMILIILAMSRISMRIVNGALDERNTQRNEATMHEYRARPPRRNLAIVCIALYTAAEFFAPDQRIGGWLALATAAALCHLQSDWHVGRALLRRWPLMLFGVYVLMAAGYALMGVSLLTDPGTFSAGRHLLTVGALGLNIYVVLNIAGRMHCGHPLDERKWVPTGAALIVAAALTRAASALPGAPSALLLALAGLLWITPFALYLWQMWPLLTRKRADGGKGCEGILSR